MRLYTNANEVEPTSDLMFYIIRMKAGAIGNVDQDLATGVMGGEFMPSLVLLLSQVYMPTLEEFGFNHRLSENQISGFLTTARRFTDSLEKCSAILKDKQDLVIPQDNSLRKFPTVVSQPIIQKLLQEQPEIVKTIEANVAVLCNQIELFVVESDKVRIEGEDTGPDSEEAFWRARMASYNHIQIQMRDIYWINNAMQILKYAGSQVVARWARVKQRIQEGTNEARDNMRYLTTITDILQPLYSN